MDQHGLTEEDTQGYAQRRGLDHDRLKQEAAEEKARDTQALKTAMKNREQHGLTEDDTRGYAQRRGLDHDQLQKEVEEEQQQGSRSDSPETQTATDQPSDEQPADEQERAEQLAKEKQRGGRSKNKKQKNKGRLSGQKQSTEPRQLRGYSAMFAVCLFRDISFYIFSILPLVGSFLHAIFIQTGVSLLIVFFVLIQKRPDFFIILSQKITSKSPMFFAVSLVVSHTFVLYRLNTAYEKFDGKATSLLNSGSSKTKSK